MVQKLRLFCVSAHKHNGHLLEARKISSQTTKLGAHLGWSGSFLSYLLDSGRIWLQKLRWCTHFCGVSNYQMVAEYITMFLTWGSFKNYIGKDRWVGSNVSKEPNVLGQSRTIQDRTFCCPFVPGQGQEQKSRDKLLCPGTSGTKWISIYLSNCTKNFSGKMNRFPVLEHYFPV